MPEISAQDLELSINIGRDWLVRQQRGDGSFACLARRGSSVKASPNVFVNALILSVVAPLRNEKGAEWQAMLRRSCGLLAKERNRDFSFNYWLRTSTERASLPYPNDLDDTALGMAAVIVYGKHSLNGAAMANLATMLIAAEHAPGGPYNTWLADFRHDERWRDIDPAVNANIAYLLSLCEVRLPALEKYFEDVLAKQAYSSLYYSSPLSILYFISRPYQGEGCDEAVAYIKERRQGSNWGSPLITALAISCLIRWEETEDLEEPLGYLIQTQINGHWNAENFYIETADSNGAWHCGSAEITTAFCLEALALAKAAANKPKTSVSPNTKHTENMRRRVMNGYRQEFEQCAPYFTDTAHKASDELLKHPFWRDNILLAHFTKEALGSRGSGLTEDMVRSLSVTQLHGLSAYSIFDDLIDAQENAKNLPFAIYGWRQFCAAYARLLPANSTVNKILSGMEEALYDEAHERLPENLAQKSLGCALPAIAVGIMSGLCEAQLEHCCGFFIQLLSARQWNDDAHDIIEDLQARRLTPANTLVMKRYREKHQQWEAGNIAACAAEIMAIFWQVVFPEVCESIKGCLRKARRELALLDPEKPEYFIKLIDSQQSALDKAIAERKHVMEFLEEYGKQK